VVDVFEEVEEGLRAERWRTLARKYGPWLAGGAAAALLVTGGVWGWNEWRESKAAEASIAYDTGMRALERGDKAAADTAFGDAAKAGSPSYKAFALMQRGGVLIGDNKTSEAVALFDQAAKAAKNPVIADLARYKAALALMDTAPYPAIEERLRPLTQEGRPYRPLAREALAMAQLSAGRTKEARAEFQLLAAQLDTPEGLRQRAQVAIQMIDSGVASRLPAIAKAAAAVPPVPEAPAGFDPFASSAGSPAPQAGAAQ